MPSQVKPTLALFFLLVVPLHAQLLVDTVIGAKPQSGVSAHDVPLSQLGGVAYDAAGNLVFCDQGLNLIRRIRPDGVIETLAGSGLAGFSGDGAAALNAALNQPALPRFDGKGNLYFADLSNFRIRRVDASGIITTIGGTGVAFQTGMDPEGPALSRSLGPIADMAVDPAGNVYFTFANNTDLIRRITPAGRLEIFAGIPHPECVYCSDGDNGPARAARIGATHLAADTKGNLFFSELAPPSDTSFATHIRRIAGDGTITRFAGYGPANGDTENDDGPPALDVYIYAISAMTADATGNLYFVQAPKPSSKAGQRIRRVDTFGFIRTLAGGGPGATTLDGPALEISVLPLAIAVDARANIAFTETLPAASPLTGSIVRRVTAQAAVQTLAGDVPAIAPSHIKPAEAWLVNPTSVAFNRAGELFIAESGACLIRKIGLDGFFVTVAGTGYCGKSLPGLPAATEDLAPPAGLLADNQGRIYMLDRAGNYYSVAASGAVSPVTELPPSVGPGKLAFDAKGRTYIMSPNSLLRVSPSGNQETIVAKPPQFGLPTNGPTSLGAIGVDPAGTVYFSGTYPAASTDYIFRVNDDASITQVYGSDATPLHLGSVTSLALDSRGNVWLGNTFVNAFGAFTLGRPDPGFSGDGGLAQSARFDAAPMAFAPNGDLYFADGKRIRKVTGAPPNPPAITGGGIVNAVSYASAAIAPGELVTIFGSGFGATELITNTLENNRLPTVLGRTKVLFDGRPGAIVAMTSTQINVFVPYSVVPGKSAAVIVQTDSAVSVPVIIPVVAAVPGLATADQTGSGPGAILNQDSSFNTAANPAARGSLVTLFGTGEGFVSPQLISGDLSISTPLSAPVGPVTVSIGDAPAEVSFAGAAPMLPVGVLQINVKIPTGISPGPAAIKVSIGGIATSKVVTVAVK